MVAIVLGNAGLKTVRNATIVLRAALGRPPVLDAFIVRPAPDEYAGVVLAFPVVRVSALTAPRAVFWSHATTLAGWNGGRALSLPRRCAVASIIAASNRSAFVARRFADPLVPHGSPTA